VEDYVDVVYGFVNGGFVFYVADYDFDAVLLFDAEVGELVEGVGGEVV